MARDLDNDPEQLSYRVIPLLRYEEAYRVHRRANADEIKAVKAGPGREVFEAVEENDFAIAERAIAADQEA